MSGVNALALVAASARGGPEQFYYPADRIALFEREITPEVFERFQEPLARLERLMLAPRRRVPVPGPNEPCSCGSGIKFKRCCSHLPRPAELPYETLLRHVAALQARQSQEQAAAGSSTGAG